MRSDCPSCQAGYDIPDALLHGPKTVRCAHCGRTWTVAPAAAGPAAPPAPDAPPARDAAAPPFLQPPLPPPLSTEPPPAPALRVPTIAPRQAEPGRRSSSRAALVGWLLTVLLLAGGAAAAVRWRGAVMQAWPASERAYAALGLASVNGGSGAFR